MSDLLNILIVILQNSSKINALYFIYEQIYIIRRKMPKKAILAVPVSFKEVSFSLKLIN